MLIKLWSVFFVWKEKFVLTERGLIENSSRYGKILIIVLIKSQEFKYNLPTVRLKNQLETDETSYKGWCRVY